MSYTKDEMKAKKWIFWSVFAGAVLATLAGLCLFFFGNLGISEIPDSLQVQVIDGKYYLLAQYSSKFNYQFKIEQASGRTYTTVAEVKSEGNLLDLTASNFHIAAGENYRFSVRFTREAKRGKYSREVPFSPKTQLQKVTGVVYDTKEKVLSWDEVTGAEQYQVSLVLEDGSTLNFSDLTQNSLKLHSLQAGVFEAYVSASSDSENVLSSENSEVFSFKIEKQNQFSQAKLTGNDLNINCSNLPAYFQVFVDGQLKVTLKAQDGLQSGSGAENLFFVFENVRVFLGDNIKNVQIKSTTFGCVLESELFDVLL